MWENNLNIFIRKKRPLQACIHLLTHAGRRGTNSRFGAERPGGKSPAAWQLCDSEHRAWSPAASGCSLQTGAAHPTPAALRGAGKRGAGKRAVLARAAPLRCPCLWCSSSPRTSTISDIQNIHQELVRPCAERFSGIITLMLAITL